MPRSQRMAVLPSGKGTRAFSICGRPGQFMRPGAGGTPRERATTAELRVRVNQRKRARKGQVRERWQRACTTVEGGVHFSPIFDLTDRYYICCEYLPDEGRVRIFFFCERGRAYYQ